ncbi:MAG: FG-GAP-like repeat-containing protein [Gemmataceae bacterium]|nr:FG-GAP-like repeat-containing protein [Gemmataceae bacterium]
MRALLTVSVLLLLPSTAAAQSPGNRLAYLDEVDPYYPSRTFPRLITPQWVGEKGVEAVVILGIDDMRDPKRYEVFLRPILRRLKQIDGRAPVSIMTNQIDPRDPQLQTWLKEGLSLETHTFDHPCPFFKGGSFEKAKATYDKCVDLLASVPNSKPVAFRMPCCDSLNTPSPRFWAEIFNKTTDKGNFLSIDTSVFNVFTANDPELPRELVLNPDGTERFRRYLPRDRSFVNTIEDYPYPYVIGGKCWEFPCVTPSDWQAQHLQKPFNPRTVDDWKAALDCTVVKQGVFCLVFHPHGWIKNDQIVELIDHAVKKHGKKVKFLTFKEAQERLNKNLLGGQPLRHVKHGMDRGVRLLDLNGDGYIDVVVGNQGHGQTRVWTPDKRTWRVIKSPPWFADDDDPDNVFEGQFAFLRTGRYPSLFFGSDFINSYFNGNRWTDDDTLAKGLAGVFTKRALGPGGDLGVRLRDLDGDGRPELIASSVGEQGTLYALTDKGTWKELPFTLPFGARVVDEKGRDNGLRLIDLDGDGKLDLIFSNEKEYGIYLFGDMKTGWSRKVMAGKRGDKDALPMISRNGTNNGFWVHSGHLWWSNEDTPLLKDHVDRRSIKELLKNEPPRPLSPEASLRALKPRPGFTVELMAAEPLVMDPVAFAFGPDGKLWVVEMGDYPLGTDGKGKHGGRVKFLEKTKASRGRKPPEDAPYDRATVFMDSLGYPTGVLPWGKGVLVTCAPDIFYAEDTDGDGKADKKEVLYTGFIEGNQQHRVNSLVWGLDNWIYCANGDSGGRVKSLKTGKVVDIRGRDFRIKPDTGEIDLQTGQTQFGRSRDDWGNWFGGNNSNPMWHFALADHYLRRNPHLAPPDPRVPVSVKPGTAPVFPLSRTLERFNDFWAFNRFTSACSPIVYRDDLFGSVVPSLREGKAGSRSEPTTWVFVSEPVHNLVHREVMTPKGVTFTSRRAADEEGSEFLASSDNWFRPAMIQTGPDGALWVADMYRHVIEHPQWIPKDWQKKLDLRAGHDLGRLYRVYPVGVKPRAIPRLDRLDTRGLVAALDSPSGWQRDMAQMLLVRKQDRSALPALRKLLKECKNPLARLHALCTLDGYDLDLKSMFVPVSDGLSDPHPGVRAHAVRLAEARLRRQQGPWVWGFDSPALVEKETDPRVRLQLAYTLGEWVNHEKAGEMLGRLAQKDGADPYLLAAILSSVKQENFASMAREVLAAPKPVAPVVLEKMSRLAGALGDAKGTAALLTSAATLRDGKYSAAQMLMLAGYLDGLEQRKLSLAQAGIASMEMSKAMGLLARVFPFARATAADPSAPLEERVAAVRLLGRGFEKEQTADRKQLAALLTPQTPDNLQAAAAAALGKLRSPDVPELLLLGWRSYGPGVRGQVLDALLARPEGARATLDRIEAKKIQPFDIDAARRNRLLEHKDSAIRQRAAKLLAGALNKDRQQVVESYRPALTMKGDLSRGLAVFKRTCSACHRLGEVGQDVGPDLNALRDRSAEALLIAILDPNQAVEARYLNYTATTKDGLTHAGLLASESGNSITLIGVDGKKHVLLRSDLDALASTGKSTMPEGLEKDISVKEMADLLAFVRSNLAVPKRKVFAGNRPEVVKAGSGGALLLTAANCEIYGPSLVLEKQYGNLGYWSSPDDHAVWTVEVPRAGRYFVWMDYACDQGAAGNRFELRAGSEVVSHKVRPTGNWDTYREVLVDGMHLEAGRQQLVMRSAGAIRGALLDLKSLRLVPGK